MKTTKGLLYDEDAVFELIKLGVRVPLGVMMLLQRDFGGRYVSVEQWRREPGLLRRWFWTLRAPSWSDSNKMLRTWARSEGLSFIVGEQGDPTEVTGYVPLK